jgi:hypothetical protein
LHGDDEGGMLNDDDDDDDSVSKNMSRKSECLLALKNVLIPLMQGYYSKNKKEKGVL